MGCAIPIIGVTGNLLPCDVAYFKMHGAKEVLNKPLNMAIFEGVLQNINENEETKKEDCDGWFDEKSEWSADD